MRDMDIEERELREQKKIGPIHAQEYLEKLEKRYKFQPPDGPECADVIYFFPEGSTKGVKLYLQCPKEALEEGKLIISKMEQVEYDKDVHSAKNTWYLRTVRDGKSYGELTKTVSPEEYVKIVLQGLVPTNSDIRGKEHYFVVDLQESNNEAFKRICKFLDKEPSTCRYPELFVHLAEYHMETLKQLVNKDNTKGNNGNGENISQTPKF